MKFLSEKKKVSLQHGGNMKLGEVVAIKWEDAYSSSGWKNMKDLRPEHYKPLIVFSFGVIIMFSKDMVLICMSLNTKDREYADTLYIPRKNIISIKVLDKVNMG